MAGSARMVSAACVGGCMFYLLVYGQHPASLREAGGNPGGYRHFFFFHLVAGIVATCRFLRKLQWEKALLSLILCWLLSCFYMALLFGPVTMLLQEF